MGNTAVKVNLRVNLFTSILSIIRNNTHNCNNHSCLASYVKLHSTQTLQKELVMLHETGIKQKCI